MQQKKFNLKKEYSEAWKYIKQSREYIYFSIIVFFIFALIGFFIAPPEYLSTKILEFIQQLLERTKNLSGLELIGFIFLNNLQSSFFIFILGFIFAIFPVIALISNGYLLGYVAATTSKIDGLLSIWRILPHGIFELPALFLALGLGIKFGGFIFNKNPKKTFLENLFQGMRVFFFFVIPLLIIAAIIEGILIILIK